MRISCLAAVSLALLLVAPAHAADDALEVKGVATASKPGPQGILLARRGAKVVARRNLIARLGELTEITDLAWLEERFTAIETDEGNKTAAGFEVTARLPWTHVAAALGQQRKQLAQAQASLQAARETLKKAEDELTAAKAEAIAQAAAVAQAKQDREQLAELRAQVEAAAAEHSSGGQPTWLLALVGVLALVIGFGAAKATGNA